MKSVNELFTKSAKFDEEKKKRLIELQQQYDRVIDNGGWYIVEKDNVQGVVLFEDGEKDVVMLDGVERIHGWRTHPRKKDNLFCVKKNGKWGYVDNFGQEIIPCIYDEIALDDLGTMVYNVISFLNDGVGKEGLDFYVDVNNENFYRALMYCLQNRYKIEKQKNDKMESEFIYNENYNVGRIIELIDGTKSKTEVLKNGLSDLQKFYQEKLVVNKHTL